MENGELLGLGSANSYVSGNYTTDTTGTYYGEAQAVVRADGAGDVTVTAEDERGPVSVTIPLSTIPSESVSSSPDSTPPASLSPIPQPETCEKEGEA